MAISVRQEIYALVEFAYTGVHLDIMEVITDTIIITTHQTTTAATTETAGTAHATMTDIVVGMKALHVQTAITTTIVIMETAGTITATTIAEAHVRIHALLLRHVQIHRQHATTKIQR